MTNPETAGVQPVAEMRERLRKIASLANAATAFREEAMMRNYQTIVGLVSPAAREDAEVVRKIAIASAYAQGFIDGHRAEGDDPDVGEGFAAYMATSTYAVTATTRPAPEQAPDDAA